MSSRWLPRTPAFEGLRPPEPEYAQADNDTAAWLCRELGVEGRVERLKTSASPPYGCYRFRGGDRALFLKVLSAGHAARHRRTDNIVRSARERAAPALAAERWLETNRGDGIGVYRLIDGRYGAPTAEDGATLGVALAKLHMALRGCADEAEIRQACAERLDMLSRRREAIVAGAPAGPDPVETLRIMESCETAFQMAPDGQVVHGDLNLGNILFDRRTGAPTIIDFENLLTSWFSPITDIAMAIQRMALTAAVDDATALSCGQAIVRGYCETNGGLPFSDGAPLVRAMRENSIRNLCLLGEMEAKAAGTTADSEWLKFVHLAQLAEAKAPLLERMATDYVG